MINKPILRFPDFINEWEMVSLNSISSQVARISDEGDYPVLTISAGNGFLEQKDRFSQVIAGNSLSKYTLLFKDELAYNRGNSKKFKYGCIYRLNDYDRALVPNVYISFRIEDGSPKFYEYLFQKKYLDRQLRQLISSSARMDGLLNISKSDFFNVKVPVTNKEEQEKIASFFSLIDKKIELQTEKVEELKNYKKGIMQKIFSQELRFKDENGNEYPEWEMKKLGQLVNVGTGKKDTKDRVEGGKYPFYVRSQIIERINTYSFDGEAILTAGDGVGVGKVFHYVNGKFDYHQRVYKLSNFTEGTNGRYIYEYFKHNFIKEVTKYTAKTSVDSVRMEMITKMNIPYPIKSEQDKIASFFSLIDKKIEKEQEKLNSLHEYKKGLLQQMFI